MIKALIIDDSRLARNELKHLLKDFVQIDIIGEATDGNDAIEKIDDLTPDLIFLDIEMPGMNGFEMLEKLECVPQVIFTTAYNEYAIKAFEVNALDYLVKPIEKVRLGHAVQKVTEKQKEAEASTDREVFKATDKVFVKDGEQCWFVQISDIRLFEVNGSYTTIYFDNFSPMIFKTLNYLESRLDDKAFFRANRQQIINLQWIERIEPWFSGNLKIYLKGGQEVEISRRQTSLFKEKMSF